MAVDKKTAELVAKAQAVRPLDGSKSNPTNCCWGATGCTLIRLTPPRVEGPHFSCPPDHKQVLVDSPVNPREVSNAVCAETTPEFDPEGRTHWMWAWGQFLDHQLDLTLEGEEVIVVPIEDGNTITFKRSRMAPGSGIAHDKPREHSNALSAYIDGSSVYGNDPRRLAALLADDGVPMLRTDGDLLPPGSDLPNATPFDNKKQLFLAGDVRANEHVVLTSMHTAFVRLHNLRVQALIDQGEVGHDRIFIRARAWVAAVMQFITFREFLPELLGNAFEVDGWEYKGFHPEVETTISTEFSSSAYRLGHSMLPDSIPVTTDVEHSTGAAGAERLPLEHAFFKPALVKAHGTAVFLDRLHTEAMRKIDPVITDGVRNFLFRFPTGPTSDRGVLDLATLNIMRGRDHCIGSYNDVRQGLGMARRAGFDEITDDAAMADRLASVYSSVDDVDLWVGGLCESPAGDAAVGETFHVILMDQFLRLRDGDRWHWRNENYPTFGESVDCDGCAGTVTAGDPDDPILTDDERNEISRGDWTLARVMLETDSVTAGAFAPDDSVFRMSGKHLRKFSVPEPDDTEGSPGCS